MFPLITKCFQKFYEYLTAGKGYLALEILESLCVTEKHTSRLLMRNGQVRDSSIFTYHIFFPFGLKDMRHCIYEDKIGVIYGGLVEEKTTKNC